MITIRLTRVGKKNDPSFRVIVVESKRKPQPGNYLEMVGSYDPRTDRTQLKAERIKHWIAMGAQTSDTVHNLLVSNKIIDAKKINVLPKKTVAKKEEPVEVAATSADAAALPLEDSALDSAAPAEVAALVAEAASQSDVSVPLDSKTEDNAVASEAAAE
ncbi:MAG TPA: 30S ribosomal protein S16 [Candidatus Paceibacterota bacterium]